MEPSVPKNSTVVLSYALVFRFCLPGPNSAC